MSQIASDNIRKTWRNQSPGSLIPLFLSYTKPSGRLSSGTFIEALRADREFLTQALQENGLLIIRGTPLEGPHDFKKAVFAFNEDVMEYLSGARVRDPHDPEQLVYVPTAVPSYLPNLLHSEQAYQINIPSKIAFFCKKASPFGGTSRFGDAAAINDSLSTELKERFQQKQLRFDRSLICQGGVIQFLSRFTKALSVAVSWQVNFATRDRNQVEAICRKNAQAFQWMPNGDLQLQTTISPTRVHPLTGKRCWLNSAHLFQIHPGVYSWVFCMVAKLYFKISGRTPSICRFGDGSEIPKADIDQILNHLEAHTFTEHLNPGDLVFVDNHRILHGRDRFFGPRRLYFAMYR